MDNSKDKLTTSVFDPEDVFKSPFEKSLDGLYINTTRTVDYGKIYKLTRKGITTVILRSLFDDSTVVVPISKIGKDYDAMCWMEDKLCIAMLPPPPPPLD